MSCGYGIVYYSGEPAVVDTSPWNIMTVAKDPWFVNHLLYNLFIPLFTFQIISAKWEPFIKSLSKGDSTRMGKSWFLWYVIGFNMLFSLLYKTIVELGLTSLNQYLCNDVSVCGGGTWWANFWNAYYFRDGYFEIFSKILLMLIGQCITTYILYKYRMTYWGGMNKFACWKISLVLLVSFAWNFVIGIYVQLNTCNPLFSTGAWNIINGTERLNALPVGVWIYWLGIFLLLLYSSYQMVHAYPDKFRDRIRLTYLSIMGAFSFMAVFSFVPLISAFFQIWIPLFVLVIGYFIYMQVTKTPESATGEDEDDDGMNFSTVEVMDK